LLAFFLMLLVIGRSDSRAGEKIKESIQKMVGREVSSLSVSEDEIVSRINDALKDKELASSFFVAKTPGGVTLTFAEGVFFETSSAVLAPDAHEILEKVAPVFADVSKTYSLDVEGHADHRPLTGNRFYASNWELSAARAGSVVRFLSEKGVASEALRAIGYSDTQPISPDLEKNRRVTIRVRGRRK